MCVPQKQNTKKIHKKTHTQKNKQFDEDAEECKKQANVDYVVDKVLSTFDENGQSDIVLCDIEINNDIQQA